MMAIHGPSLGILPILLTILLTILPILFTTFTLAIPFKTLVDLDLSGEPPIRIRMMPSKAYPGATHHIIQGNVRATHVIGMVRDGDEILMDGDPTAMSRYILVHPRGDGMRYIRVTTRWRSTNKKYKTSIDEFMKSPVDAHYAPVARVPIEVDVFTQDIDERISIELLEGWEEHDRRPGATTEDVEDMPLKFTISEEMAMEVMIGVVKYGHHIVDDDVEGLMEREVIWVGGQERPWIIITSRYNDGRGTETKHTLVGENRGFLPYWSKNLAPKLYE